MNTVYPYKFHPIYKEKIWGGRNLQRLFGRQLPAGKKIGESWDLCDLAEGVSVVSNGPEAGKSLTELTLSQGGNLLGGAEALENGRFPLLLKLLDANEMLSLQVHPDAEAVAQIGPEAALKTECWYFLESRGGLIQKGVREGVTPDEFRRAIETDTVEKCVRSIPVSAGDFHYLPAGIVHAIGAGLVVAEVQTPSDTTYRVTDWGRGREIHVERSMQCIRFDLTGDCPPGADGETLLVTDYFTVAKRSTGSGEAQLPAGRCAAIMLLESDGGVEVHHEGPIEPSVPVSPGDTVLVPAGLGGSKITTKKHAAWLEITLPEQR